MTKPGDLSSGHDLTSRYCGIDGRRLLNVGLVTFLLAYLGSCLISAWHTPLWMDEVLATWVARLPTVDAIIRADYQGSDAIPPTFSLLLHYLIRCFGDHRIVLRLPGILATMGSSFCLLAVLRRSLGQTAAIGV